MISKRACPYDNPPIAIRTLHPIVKRVNQLVRWRSDGSTLLDCVPFVR
jgi:hypothetical protein